MDKIKSFFNKLFSKKKINTILIVLLFPALVIVIVFMIIIGKNNIEDISIAKKVKKLKEENDELEAHKEEYEHQIETLKQEANVITSQAETTVTMLDEEQKHRLEKLKVIKKRISELERKL